MNETVTTLEDKILLAQIRIRQWHDHWNGKICVDFSGGLDSTVLLHLVRDIYPETPGIFADTGLEWPEIRNFVKSVDNVVWVKPFMPFKKVLETHGYPVISKQTAFRIRIITENKLTTKRTVHFYKTGQRSDGTYSGGALIPDKWMKLCWAPFKVSEKCCHELKTGPLRAYHKKTKRRPFVGLRSDEGGQRSSLKNVECNMYDSRYPKSVPLIKWSNSDIREYIKINKLAYSTIYDKGHNRTGCMFCMFGIHMEKGENKFQKMAVSHPRHYNTCMNKLGLRKVLEYLDINPNPKYERKGFFDKEEINGKNALDTP